jgi:hypothetical protein
MCNLQAEATTAGLKINSKEAKELQKKFQILINVNKILIENVDSWVML